MSQISITVLFFAVFTLFNQLTAKVTSCEESAALDVANDAINKAKESYPTCEEAENDDTDCGKKEKSLAYLEVAKSLISTAKKQRVQECQEIYSLVEERPIDCLAILHYGNNISGVYDIWPWNRIYSDKPLRVYCDMDTDKGGWTVIQRRGNFTEQENFYRNWSDYRDGFGNLTKEFWLGNENIYALTNQARYMVRFDLEDAKGEKRYAVYNSFWIHEEESNYLLHVTNYSGNAGDSMAYHNNHSFLTKDRGDQDRNKNCADVRKAGWWYDFCTESNPNGVYQPGVVDKKGITWYSFKGEESLASIEIKVKRNHFVDEVFI